MHFSCTNFVELMRQRNMTLADVAAAASMRMSDLEALVNEDSSATPVVVVNQLAKALGCNIADLLTDQEGVKNAAHKGLAVMLYSGDFDKIHYGLAVAAAAAAIEKPVTVFVTMGACYAFMHDDSGRPGWHYMTLSNSMHNIAITSPKELNSYYQSQGIAKFDELLDACLDLGVQFMVCEMGLRATGIPAQSLSSKCKFTVTGLVSFLNLLTKDTNTVTI